MCWPSCAVRWERAGWARGTLDPMATGVLAVFIGNATAAADRQPDHDKTYEATIRLGLRTDTGDVTGTALETAPVTVGEAELKAVLPQFMGRQMQLPPMYSAVKINGQPLYKAARKGQTVERTPRPITIYEITYLGSPARGIIPSESAAPRAPTSAFWRRISVQLWACPPHWRHCAAPAPGRSRLRNATPCRKSCRCRSRYPAAKWMAAAGGTRVCLAACPDSGRCSEKHLLQRLPHQPLPRTGRQIPRV